MCVPLSTVIFLVWVVQEEGACEDDGEFTASSLGEAQPAEPQPLYSDVLSSIQC